MGKNLLLQWECVKIFYLGLVWLLVAFVGCFVTLVAATSMMVGILVSALVLIDLDAR